MQSLAHRSGIPVLALAGAVAVACAADTTGLETLSVAEVAARLAAASPPVVCDANSEKTRAKNGTLPGAVLLSNYRDYDASHELPPDRERALIFYCHSPMCGAAAEAARKAVAAGYRRVSVMPEGIRGWAGAGQPVARVEVSP